MRGYPLRRTLVVGAAAALLCGFAGCIAVGGSDRYYKPTLGRQLMDLKTARDTGAIKDHEYEQAKDDLLRGRITSAQAH